MRCVDNLRTRIVAPVSITTRPGTGAEAVDPTALLAHLPQTAIPALAAIIRFLVARASTTQVVAVAVPAVLASTKTTGVTASHVTLAALHVKTIGAGARLVTMATHCREHRASTQAVAVVAAAAAAPASTETIGVTASHAVLPARLAKTTGALALSVLPDTNSMEAPATIPAIPAHHAVQTSTWTTGLMLARIVPLAALLVTMIGVTVPAASMAIRCQATSASNLVSDAVQTSTKTGTATARTVALAVLHALTTTVPAQGASLATLCLEALVLSLAVADLAALANTLIGVVLASAVEMIAMNVTITLAHAKSASTPHLRLVARIASAPLALPSSVVLVASLMITAVAVQVSTRTGTINALIAEQTALSALTCGALAPNVPIPP